MNDEELQPLFQQARRVQARVTEGMASNGFESGLMSVIQSGLRQTPAFPAVWLGVGACAAVTGLLAILFVLTQASSSGVDEISSFWAGSHPVDHTALNTL